MPSVSWHEWSTTRAAELDEIESAHAAVGGIGRGRRYATEQINHAYAVLLAAQFQGFCRDLHSECAEVLVKEVPSTRVQDVMRWTLLLNRSLDRGNANAGAIGSEFGRLCGEFWDLAYAEDARNRRRRAALDELNVWRNAIAHQNFEPVTVAGTATLHLDQVRQWRRACDYLAGTFDRVMHAYLAGITGTAPW